MQDRDRACRMDPGLARDRNGPGQGPHLARVGRCVGSFGTLEVLTSGIIGLSTCPLSMIDFDSLLLRSARTLGPEPKGPLSLTLKNMFFCKICFFIHLGILWSPLGTYRAL